MGEFKRIFCGVLLILWTCFLPRAVLAQESGATPWKELPFGQIRLLSCREGIKNNPMMVGGLQIQLNKGWFLKKPHLETLDKKMPLWLDYPIRPDAQETRVYQGNLFIPLVGTALSKDSIFGIQGELEGCRSSQDCLKLPLQFQIPLSVESDAYTGYCAFIMDQMNQVPLPQPKELTSQIKILPDKQFELIFSGLKGIHQAFLQNDLGVKFKVLEREFIPQGVRFLISVKQIPPKQNWILITNQGIFRIKKFQSPSKEIIPDFPWVKLIFGGFLLFLCSPFFFWWGLNWPKKKERVALQSSRMAEQATYMILLWGGISIFFLPDLQNIFHQPIYLWTVLGILIITLIVPFKNPWMVAGLFLIYPKPYLNDLFGVFAEQKSLWVAGIVNFILWAWFFFEMRAKFGNFLEKKIQIGLKKACFRTNLFFLLPTLILTCYVGRFLVQGEIEFKNQIVSGLNIVCAPYSSECSAWQKEKVLFINSSTSLGQKLLKKYNRVEGPLVILESTPERTIFLKDTSTKEVKDFMIDWRNYHVLGKPENQPIHFGDDPHAP